MFFRKKSPDLRQKGRGKGIWELGTREKPRASISATACDIPMTLTAGNMAAMLKPDRIEAARKAHDLIARHGANRALLHAERIAQQALADNKTDEHRFWSAVVEALRPH